MLKNVQIMIFRYKLIKNRVRCTDILCKKKTLFLKICTTIFELHVKSPVTLNKQAEGTQNLPKNFTAAV